MRFEEAISVALAELGSANAEALQRVRLYIPNVCMEYVCFPQGRDNLFTDLFAVQLQYVCTCVETILTQKRWTPTLSDLTRTDWRYHLSHRRVILVNEVLRIIPVTRKENL